MTTLYHPTLLQHARNYTVLLDTNVFSTASRSEGFAAFLEEFKRETSCVYATISSVIFETTNGSNSIDVYNQRSEYIKSLVDITMSTAFIEEIVDFSVLMAKLNGNNKSFTDFQLAACLYNYRHADVYLLTTDLKAFPQFFDRDFLITTEQNSGKVVNFGLYRLNRDSYEKAHRNIFRL